MPVVADESASARGIPGKTLAQPSTATKRMKQEQAEEAEKLVVGTATLCLSLLPLLAPVKIRN